MTGKSGPHPRRAVEVGVRQAGETGRTYESLHSSDTPQKPCSSVETERPVSNVESAPASLFRLDDERGFVFVSGAGCGGPDASAPEMVR